MSKTKPKTADKKAKNAAPPGIVLPPGGVWPMTVKNEIARGTYASPIPVPVEVTHNAAPGLMDRDWRVFITPKSFFVEPNDQADPAYRKCSYAWVDWWSNGVLDTTAYATWLQHCTRPNATPLNPLIKLKDCWPRCCQHAWEEWGGSGEFSANRLSYWVFKRPTVFNLEVAAVPEEPYTLYYSDETKAWSYVRQVARRSK